MFGSPSLERASPFGYIQLYERISHMVEPVSSFEGIGQLDEELAAYAATAERIFSDQDPTFCLITLRKFGERLARRTAERYDVSLSVDDDSSDELKSTSELLGELKSILPRDTIEHFYTVNKLGNKGAHDDDNETPTHEDARKALESARKLALWFFHENSQTPTRDKAEYVAGGNERRTTTIDQQRPESPVQNLFWRRVGFAVLALVGIVVWYLWDNRSANVDARLEEQRRIEIIRRQREQQQDEERRNAEQRRHQEEQMRRTEQQRQQQEFERRVAMITEGIRSGRCGGNPRGAYWCCDPGMWARPGGGCSRSR